MNMPPSVIKLMMGSVFLLVHTMLKLKSLPEAEREQLKVAEKSLIREILAFDRAERATQRMMEALEREEG